MSAACLPGPGSPAGLPGGSGDAVWFAKAPAWQGLCRKKTGEKTRPLSSSAPSLHSALSISEFHGAGSSSYMSESPREKKRPGSGRFYSDELQCFKRIPTPVNPKNGGYCRGGLMRRIESGDLAAQWRLASGRDPGTPMDGHLSPAASLRRSRTNTNDSFWASPLGQQFKLPLEDSTATVLEQIYPRNRNMQIPEGFERIDNDWYYSAASKLYWNSSEDCTYLRDRKALHDFVQANSAAKSDGAALLTATTPQHRGRAQSGRGRGNKFLSDVDENAERGRTMTGMDDTASVADKDGARSPSPHSTRRHGQKKLLAFRSKMLEKFQTVRSAFEQFATESESGMTRELTRKQFSRFLSNYFPTLCVADQHAIFDFLDANKNGRISLDEFHTAVEASAPVRSIEDLRRKWIALGFTTMKQAIQVMAGGASAVSERRMEQVEFGRALSRVGIEDEDEHKAVFNAIRDLNDARQSVSIEQLISALAAVSPAMLLEEMRDKLIKKFGDLDRGYEALDPQRGMAESVAVGRFYAFSADQFNYNGLEARKAFALMNMDETSGAITKKEFIGSMRLSEPSLILEDFRRKIRQRFRSISEAFAKEVDRQEEAKDLGRSSVMRHVDSDANSPMHAEEDGDGDDGRRSKKKGSPSKGKKVELSLDDFSSAAAGEDIDVGVGQENLDCSSFASILKGVQLSEQDTQTLFELIDADGNRRVSYIEFEKGINMFAPACILDDLRVHLISMYGSVAEAFKRLSQEQREQIMDLKQVEALMKDLGVASGFRIKDIFSLLESRKEGGLTVAELLAALQSCASGSQVPLTAEQRDAKAKQSVKWTLAPFQKSAAELRNKLRRALADAAKPIMDSAESKDAGMRRQLSAGEDSAVIGSRRQVPHGVVKCSYDKVAKYISPATPGQPQFLDGVHGYYVNAGVAMAHDIPLLSPTHSRAKQHAKATKHRKLLARDAPLIDSS
eukprot:TRINITY_DN122343_c0_g1_i1.p1 TRINITY_DN122343_c0_g1~~TRINITY_DN122343_c0_g1_i1.p1  ORF type:complete len:960 (+),score=267.65 TRINITY_DN122343_c0_g1_i1:83-2962(+)